MSQQAALNVAVPENSSRGSGIKRFFRVFFGRGVVVIGMLIILLFIIAAIFSPWLSPYPPDAIDARASL